MLIVFRDGWSKSFVAGTRLTKDVDRRWWLEFRDGTRWRLDDDPAEVIAI
jgi:hypothetical protein